MLLAGDVGGTKTLLGMFARAPKRPTPIEVRTFTTTEYDSLSDMIAAFLAGRHGQAERIEAACFGVAGAVLDQMAYLSNVQWTIDAGEVRKRFETPRVALLNDLVVMGHSVSVLSGDELCVLQEGLPVPGGNVALIAAGTGLGEGLLCNIDGRLIPSPSEGGHADFCARTPREIELLIDLTRHYGRAHCEHVISGPGLVNVYRFTHRDRECVAIPDDTEPGDMPKLISSAGLERRCPACEEALDLFVGAYGAETGNLAMRFMATAGVYIGGGIAPKILPALTGRGFLEAFHAKAPMADLLEAIPVWVILNPHAGLIGAAVYANQL